MKSELMFKLHLYFFTLRCYLLLSLGGIMFRLKNVDQETIKDSNKKLILNLLREKREMTKQQIAKDIGVSIPTVISNTKELMDEGLVEEAGVADSSGGRKPVIVNFKPNARYSFGVEIDIFKVKIILLNLDSEILAEEQFTIDNALGKITDEKDIHILIQKISICILNIIKEKQIDKQFILGVGIALPGTVNEENKVLEWAPNLSVRNISFKDMEKILELPVYLENEANAAAMAELKLGVAKNMRNLVYISIKEGIGTGIVVKDYLYKGKNKKAGEFGHMTIVKDGRACKCGKNGCLEQYASQAALMHSYSLKLGLETKDLKAFFKGLDEGEKEAKEVWEEYLDYLAIGIQNIILILDPHYIVLGGELCDYEKQFMEPLKDKIFTPNSFFSIDDIRIFTSKLKNYSAIIGAAMLPQQKLFNLNDNIL
jgi:predicted NBD/HSP70 family sugar kinase